jgi:hypothetical protein
MKHPMTGLVAAALLAGVPGAQAGMLYTYTIDVPSSEFTRGSSLSGSITLDLDLLADPSNITDAEINAADYSILYTAGVFPPASASR